MLPDESRTKIMSKTHFLAFFRARITRRKYLLGIERGGRLEDLVGRVLAFQKLIWIDRTTILSC